MIEIAIFQTDCIGEASLVIEDGKIILLKLSAEKFEISTMDSLLKRIVLKAKKSKVHVIYGTIRIKEHSRFKAVFKKYGFRLSSISPTDVFLLKMM